CSSDLSLLFNELSVLMQVSCSLSADFGEVDDPKIESSEGITFDKITSPVNLYVVTRSEFNNLMDKLAKFPWITQNIRSVSLVPSILLENKTVKVNPTSFTFNHLYSLRDNATTELNKFDNSLLKISKTINEMYQLFGLDPDEDKHLLRNEYTTTEVYTFNGDQLFIDNGLLSDKYVLFFLYIYVIFYIYLFY